MVTPQTPIETSGGTSGITWHHNTTLHHTVHSCVRKVHFYKFIPSSCFKIWNQFGKNINRNVLFCCTFYPNRFLFYSSGWKGCYDLVMLVGDTILDALIARPVEHGTGNLRLLV